MIRQALATVKGNHFSNGQVHAFVFFRFDWNFSSDEKYLFNLFVLAHVRPARAMVHGYGWHMAAIYSLRSCSTLMPADGTLEKNWFSIVVCLVNWSIVDDEAERRRSDTDTQRVSCVCSMCVWMCYSGVCMTFCSHPAAFAIDDHKFIIMKGRRKVKHATGAIDTFVDGKSNFHLGSKIHFRSTKLIFDWSISGRIRIHLPTDGPHWGISLTDFCISSV